MDFPGHEAEFASPESFLLALESEDGVALRLCLQTDLCLPNGLRQWSGKNTIEKDQREGGRRGEKKRDVGK